MAEGERQVNRSTLVVHLQFLAVCAGLVLLTTIEGVHGFWAVLDVVMAFIIGWSAGRIVRRLR